MCLGEQPRDRPVRWGAPCLISLAPEGTPVNYQRPWRVEGPPPKTES
jgi:hypothetical protein